MTLPFLIRLAAGGFSGTGLPALPAMLLNLVPVSFSTLPLPPTPPPISLGLMSFPCSILPSVFSVPSHSSTLPPTLQAVPPHSVRCFPSSSGLPLSPSAYLEVSFRPSFLLHLLPVPDGPVLPGLPSHLPDPAAARSALPLFCCTCRCLLPFLLSPLLPCLPVCLLYTLN